MILELYASLVISTTNIKEVKNDNLGDYSNHSIIVPGDSIVDSIQKEQELAEQKRISAQQTVARKTVKNYGRGESYTSSGYDIKVVGTSWEQCVIYYKRQTGISRSLGYAGRINPQGSVAKLGAGALERGHISLVIADYGSEIRVREANWIRGKITERTIPKSQIRGYLYN